MTAAISALVAASHEFPSGTRVVARDGKMGTAIQAHDHVVSRGAQYQTLDSAFVRLAGFERGFGGPYIAIRFDGQNVTSDRCASALVKTDEIEAPTNVTVIVNVIVNP